MQHTNTNIVIIGSGIAGLYSAYTIKKNYPLVSFIILEKYPKKHVGGRIGNDTFYGTEIVRGAGIGRKHKDVLLQQLLVELDIPINTFPISCNYAPSVDSVVNIDKTIKLLKTEFLKNKALYSKLTFSKFSKKVLGYKLYSQFVETTGYSDYEKADIWQTLTDYGMDDNKFQSIGFKVDWNELTRRLIEEIGPEHFIFSQNVERISFDKSHNQYIVETCPKTTYNCHTVIVATTIDTLRTLFPHHSIYSQIEGQPFVRIYGKFTKRSAMIMQQHVSKMTIVSGILQKIVPINPIKGVYMIAYSDNQNAKELFSLYDNTDDNRQQLCRLLEKALDLEINELDLIAIKSYYWHIGTHYYKPLDQTTYATRKEFIDIAQHPANNIFVVGEVVSRNQGWIEGALQSVNDVLLPTI
jgi:hypothetical protein